MLTARAWACNKRGEYPFFYFDVPNSGETTLTAKAGDCTDESYLRHVDEPNRDYVLQEEGAVINWFEIETPPGYMSINDTIGDILATTRGKLLALRIVQMVRANMKKNKGGSTGGMADMAKGMKINKSLIDMGKGFTVKRVCMMAGGLFTKEQILEINAKLNKNQEKSKSNFATNFPCKALRGKFFAPHRQPDRRAGMAR